MVHRWRGLSQSRKKPIHGPKTMGLRPPVFHNNQFAVGGHCGSPDATTHSPADGNRPHPGIFEVVVEQGFGLDFDIHSKFCLDSQRMT